MRLPCATNATVVSPRGDMKDLAEVPCEITIQELQTNPIMVSDPSLHIRTAANAKLSCLDTQCMLINAV